MNKINTKLKIFTTVLVSGFLIFGFILKTSALTNADLELLISLGLIPEQNAEQARTFLNQTNTISPGTSIKLDPTSDRECLVLNQNLLKGKSGSAVSALQRFLKSEGHYPATQEITGYFGDVTVQAVADFQVATGLIKTSKQTGAGTVGPVTRDKIQEVSCKKLAEKPAVTENTTITPTSTPVIVPTTTKKTKLPEILKPAQVTMQDYTVYENSETGDLKVRYEVNVKPENDASYIEVILVCDPSAVKFTYSKITECGKPFIIEPLIRGRKSMTIAFKNTSRVAQPIAMGVEVFDINNKSLGTAEMTNIVPVSTPVIKLDYDNNKTTQLTSSFKSRSCSRNEQIDFIRYHMSPYNPTDPISLPICWPGELLCDRKYPHAYCKITGGPSSDDLCIKSQKFVNGKCVPRE